MGAPEPEMSVADRLSTALDRLEKLTPDSPALPESEDPKTVEEAVGRMKRKVADEG